MGDVGVHDSDTIRIAPLHSRLVRSKAERSRASARRWELWACGRHGHLTYAPAESDLADHLRASTPQGDVWRCLRCGDYVLGGPHGQGPAEDAPLPMRGPQIREALIMRLLALERFVRALVLVAASYGIWKFGGSKDAVQRALNNYLPILHQLSQKLNVNLEQAAPMRFIEKALHAHEQTIVLIALGVLVYGVIELAEGVGLWSLKRWGEYVAVVGTSIFLPLEIYELTDKFSVLKAITFLINVALVVWLVWSKRLFGARGGTSAYEARRHTASIMEVTRAAAEPMSPPNQLVE